MSKYISKFSGYEVDAYISKIINGEVVLENTINEIEENKSNPVTSETLYNKFKDINDIFNIINKDIDIFKKQLDEILKGNVGLLSEIIGVDDNGDVYIKQNGDKPRNFYTYGTISFGGNSDNDTEPTIIANLSDLLDVSLNNITNGQSLVYENGYWVNKEIKTGLTDEEINNMLNPINTRITNIENKINPLEIKVNSFETRLAFFENVIGIDEITGDVYIKKNGDLPRNFYTHGTISFGGLSIDEDVSIVNKISDLSDVFINNISANQILVWDTTILNDSGSYGAWVNKDLEQGLNTEELDIYLRNNEYVQKTYVDNRITDLINGAPAAYDTLKEIADVLSSNVNSIGDIMLTLSKKADKGTTLADYGITDALDNTTKYALADSVGGNALNALKLGGHESLYYATAVGLTEVSNRVKTLEDVIGIDDNGDVYIKKNNGNPRNFYTYGVISFNGLDIESGDSPSTGNITISVNGVEYTSINGYIELPSYPTALKNPYTLTINGTTYDGSEAVNITVEAGISSVTWNDILNKPNFATVATSGKYNDLSGLPTIPTNNNQLTNGAGYITSSALNGYAKLTDIPASLPASDVYAWAKAATKPSYAFSEITGKPTTLGGYGITDALSTSGGTISGALTVSNYYGGLAIENTTKGNIAHIVYNGGAEWAVTTHGWTAEYSILTAANYSSYALPLSGGELQGTTDTPLYLNGTDGSYIGFRNSAKSILGYFGFDSEQTPKVHIGYNYQYAIIHSGNIGSQSVASADIISNGTYHYPDAILTNDITADVLFGEAAHENKVFPAFFSNHPLFGGQWADVLHYTGYCKYGATQIASEYNAINPRVAIRKYNQTRNDWGDWTEFITTANIGSQSVNTAKQVQDKRDDNGAFFGSRYNALGIEGGATIWTYGIQNPITLHTNGIEVMRVGGNGNVLIGTTSDNGFKLQVGGGMSVGGGMWVDGVIQTTSAISMYFYGTNVTCGLYPDNWISGTNPRRLWLYNDNTVAVGGLQVEIHSQSSLLINHKGNNYNEGIRLGNLNGVSSTWSEINFGCDTSVTAGTHAYQWTVGRNGNNYFVIRNYEYDRVNIDLSGNMYLYSNLIVSGTLVFGSDIRYKDIIENINIDIETIANAPLFNYKWNDRDDKKVHLGTSAQYWYETVFKNAVVPTTDEKLWTMGYAEIALGNTITLAKELIPIKKEVNKIKVLEERIKKLENILIDNNIIFD